MTGSHPSPQNNNHDEDAKREEGKKDFFNNPLLLVRSRRRLFPRKEEKNPSCVSASVPPSTFLFPQSHKAAAADELVWNSTTVRHSVKKYGSAQLVWVRLQTT